MKDNFSGSGLIEDFPAFQGSLFEITAHQVPGHVNGDSLNIVESAMP